MNWGLFGALTFLLTHLPKQLVNIITQKISENVDIAMFVKKNTRFCDECFKIFRTTTSVVCFFPSKYHLSYYVP